MKHVLIIGNGYVGRETATLFREKNWAVTTVSRGSAADEHADVSSVPSLEALKSRIGEVTHVVHCASASGGGEKTYRSVYLEGARNLVKVFPSSHKLFTSSTSVYPQTDGSMVTEESATEVERVTGQILLAAEQVILASGGLVVRLAGLYGSGRCYFLRRFLAGESTLEENGSKLLNYTHHADAASAIVFLMERGESGFFNVCDSNPRGQKETYSQLCSQFDRPMPPSVPKNLNSKRGWSDKKVSNGKLCALGWQPQYPSFVDAAAEVAKSL